MAQANPQPTTAGTTATATTAGGAPAQSAPPGVIGRVLGALGGIVGATNSWALDEAREKLDSLGLLLRVSILAPIALFIVGEVIGLIGVNVDSDTTVVVAEYFFAAGTVIGAILITWLWTRIMFYSHGVALLSRGVAGISDRFREAGIEMAKVDAFLYWLRGWTAWFIGALLILTYVPVYRNALYGGLLLAALLGLAAIMSANWNQSRWPRRLLTVFVVLVVVSNIMRLATPAVHQSISSWVSNNSARATTEVNRRASVALVEAQASEQEALDDAQRLQLNHERMAELRQRANDERCAGFCSRDDLQEYRRLQRENAAIREGSLRALPSEEQNQPTKRVGAAGNQPSAASAPARATAGGSRLPPPPQVSRTPRGGSHHARSRSEAAASASPTSRNRSGQSAASSDDFGLGEFSAYPDL
jgi:hypothetical protein